MKRDTDTAGRDASREQGARRETPTGKPPVGGSSTGQPPTAIASSSAEGPAQAKPPANFRRRRRRPKDSPDVLRRREALHRRREIARRRLAEGISPEQITADFLHWGVDEEHTRDAVAFALEQRRRDQLHDSVQPIWVGGSMLLVGVLLTLIGFERSSLADGRIHRYLLLGVAILPAAAAYAAFGLIHLLSLEQAAKSKPESAAPRVPHSESFPNPLVLPVPPARPEQAELTIDLPQRAAA